MDVSQHIDRLKESFLWAAARNGMEEDCVSLMELGADVNWKSKDGETPLMAAAQNGHKGVVSLCLASGADPSIISDTKGKGRVTFFG